MDKLFVSVVVIISVLVVASLAYTLVNASNDKGLSGFAVSATCTDTDGGKNYELKGTVVKGGASKPDYCSSAVKLVEYYCSNNNIKYVSYTCGSGKICNNGACLPSCNPATCISLGKNCGSWPNGCGGTLSCGTCDTGYTCDYGICTSICVPNCAGKNCGSDGCGGSCGTCNPGEFCDNGACIPSCTPNCIGKQCGSDGCGGSCGNCSSGYTCNLTNECAPIISASCSDTDNIANQPYEAGTVSGYLNGSYYSNSDYCTGLILTEYSCSGNYKFSWNFNCAIYAGTNGRCEAGACTNQTI